MKAEQGGKSLHVTDNRNGTYTFEFRIGSDSGNGYLPIVTINDMSNLYIRKMFLST